MNSSFKFVKHSTKVGGVGPLIQSACALQAAKQLLVNMSYPKQNE